MLIRHSGHIRLNRLNRPDRHDRHDRPDMHDRLSGEMLKEIGEGLIVDIT